MRGAGHARTSNRVRRSMFPPRRPRLARARTVALSIPRSSGLSLPQQANGTSRTTALLGRHLPREAWCVYGHRGLRIRPVVRLVLGLGGAVSFLAGDHPSAGVSSTNRWFRWRRDRRRRASDLRGLLLRRHVDVVDEVDGAGEVAEGCARVSAGSGSHNLDAPLPGAPKMSGKLIAHEHLWNRSPFSVRQGSGGSTKSGSRCTREQFTQVRAARMRKTLLLPWFVIEFLAREQEDLQCLKLATPSVRVIWNPNPPMLCMGLLL